MTSQVDSYHSPLWDLGIEEAEPMVCEDSFENRRRLRTAGIMWTQLNDPDTNLPSGMIRAFTEEELTARRDSVWQTRKPLLVDPENPYSEYIGPEDMPMDADVPWWVKLRLRSWMEASISGNKPKQFPVRCEVIRTDGTRCWSWAGNPKAARRCKKHLPWEMDTDTANAKLARLKVLQASPAAADSLEELMLDKDQSGAVRLKAATEILDRAGVRGGAELDITGVVEHVDSSQEVKDRLDRLSSRLAKAALAREAAELEKKVDEETYVVEAEIVEVATDDPE